MKIPATLSLLTIAATASAGACRPKNSTATAWGDSDPTSTMGLSSSTTAWGIDPAKHGSDGSDGSWGTGPSGKTISTVDATSYGRFTKPTATGTRTSSSGYYATPSSNASDWGSTSPYAKSHRGCVNGPNTRGCWHGDFDVNTDTETSWPNTGRVVKYTLTVTNVTLSPDGTPKEMLAVNGQMPGPLVECNWGDILELTVKNELTCNGTSMHWHGMRQLHSNPQDGVNGITECPIAPGDEKTYRFQATEFGTTWYHSHFSAQYGDGVIGPLVVHGPASANYDIDLGTIQVSENFPLTIYQEDWFAERTGPPTASNYLLNGQNAKPDGSAGTRPTWKFTPGKKHLLRLINTAVDNFFTFQLDGHVFTVISTDFVSITPYQTNSLNIAIGQRYDVVVEANQPVAPYYLRAIAQAACSRNLNSGLGTSNGIIIYDGANSSIPTSNYTALPPTGCVDEPLASLVPVVPHAVDSTSFVAQASTLPVNISRVVVAGEGSVFRWTLNGLSMDIDWSNPTVAQAVAGNDTFPQINDVITLRHENAWTFWVIQNQFFVPHPMHLHGHDFSVLGNGIGVFNDSDIASLNFVNPPRRDVAMLAASGWTVIAFQADNPGAWLMHCHIAWHVGEGLSVQFLELPDRIPDLYKDTINGKEFQGTCKNWNKYYTSSANVFNRTDSGLKRRHDPDLMDVNAHLRGHAHVRRHTKRRGDIY